MSGTPNDKQATRATDEGASHEEVPRPEQPVQHADGEGDAGTGAPPAVPPGVDEDHGEQGAGSVDDPTQLHLPPAVDAKPPEAAAACAHGGSFMSGRARARGGGAAWGPVYPQPGDVSDKTLNLLCAGSTGLGKSTFCRSLVNFHWTPPPSGGPVSADDIVDVYVTGAQASAARGETPPGKPFLVRSCTVTFASGSRTTLNLFDSAGFGGKVNNAEAVQNVLQAVQERLEAHLKLWGHHDFSRMAREDARFHGVLFFCQPGRTNTEQQRDVLLGLKGKVPIIPIIAKADTMVVSERERNLVALQEWLRELGIPVYDFGEVQDESWVPEVSAELKKIEKATREAANNAREGAVHSEIPAYPEASDGMSTSEPTAAEAMAEGVPLKRISNHFAVMAGGNRVYPWGTARAGSEFHSDFAQLQMLLLQGNPGCFQPHTALLKAQTEEMWTAWVASRPKPALPLTTMQQFTQDSVHTVKQVRAGFTWRSMAGAALLLACGIGLERGAQLSTLPSHTAIMAWEGVVVGGQAVRHSWDVTWAQMADGGGAGMVGPDFQSQYVGEAATEAGGEAEQVEAEDAGDVDTGEAPEAAGDAAPQSVQWDGAASATKE